MKRLLTFTIALLFVPAAHAAQPLSKMNTTQLKREASRSHSVVAFFEQHPYGRYASAFRHRTCRTVERVRRGRCFYARNRARWHQERLARIERILTPPVSLGPLSCLSCWDAVADCESGQVWSLNTGNDFYGGLQWLLSTWHAYGGGRYASNPVYATRMQQISIASRMSLSHWPVCGARY